MGKPRPKMESRRKGRLREMIEQEDLSIVREELTALESLLSSILRGTGASVTATTINRRLKERADLTVPLALTTFGL